MPFYFLGKTFDKETSIYIITVLVYSNLYPFTFLHMFTGRIVSRSNINGKVHTFQKDFDDYDTYQKFIAEHPEYSNDRLFSPFLDPWSALESWMTPLDS